ncbi:MAG: glycosyltransferase family 2 protein [Leadbetterella sp.]
MAEFSIVIPVYYSENTIFPLVKKLKDKLSDHTFQIILVNDGSKDKSHESCLEAVKTYKNITYIQLRKNFGEFNAVMCGLSKTIGEFAIIIDDDFQNPPSEISKLIETYKSGDYDVVYSQYTEKKHNFFRNIGSSITNYLVSGLIGKPKDLYLSSFKLISKEIIDEIVIYTGPFPYIDGLIFQVTDNIGKVEVEHHSRANGKSTYTTGKLFSLFMNAILGFSILPIRILNFIGIAAILYATGMLIFNIQRLHPEFPASRLFKDGIIVTAISIIGEYLGKSFLILSGKPQYIIKKSYNS